MNRPSDSEVWEVETSKPVAGFLAWLIVLLPTWLGLIYAPTLIQYLLPRVGWVSYLGLFTLPFLLGFLLLGLLSLPVGLVRVSRGGGAGGLELRAFAAFCVTMLVFVYGVRPPVRAWMASHPPGGSLTKFHRQAWLADETGQALTPRQAMIVDVIATCVDGESRSEIEALLGPPSKHRSDQGMFYKLGPHRGAIMDPDAEYLKITFDAGGLGKGKLWQE